jgi:hypothetical protein
MSELAGSRCKLLHHELTGSYVFTFQADSDDVVPKSASRRSSAGFREARFWPTSECLTIRSGTRVLREITTLVLRLGDHELISFQCHLDTLR